MGSHGSRKHFRSGDRSGGSRKHVCAGDRSHGSREQIRASGTTPFGGRSHGSRKHFRAGGRSAPWGRSHGSSEQFRAGGKSASCGRAELGIGLGLRLFVGAGMELGLGHGFELGLFLNIFGGHTRTTWVQFSGNSGQAQGRGGGRRGRGGGGGEGEPPVNGGPCGGQKVRALSFVFRRECSAVSSTYTPAVVRPVSGRVSASGAGEFWGLGFRVSSLRWEVSGRTSVRATPDPTGALLF